jgi:hypothetical protein
VLVRQLLLLFMVLVLLEVFSALLLWLLLRMLWLDTHCWDCCCVRLTGTVLAVRAVAAGYAAAATDVC